MAKKEAAKKPKPKGSLAAQLKAAVAEIPPEPIKEAAPTVVVDRTPPKIERPVLKSFKGIERGSFIVLEYSLGPARIPGNFGAEVVSVSADSVFLDAKILLPTKAPRAVSLRMTKDGARDQRDDRPVGVRLPNIGQASYLKELKQRSLTSSSGEMPPLKMREVAAFVYPKPGATDNWAAGVSVGQVNEVSPLGEEGEEYQVTFYYSENLGTEEAVSETLRIRRSPDSTYRDLTYGAKLALVRRPTEEESRLFARERSAVLSHLAIPNAEPPKQ